MSYIANFQQEPRNGHPKLNIFEKFDELTDAKRFLANKIADVIEEDIIKYKVDIFDTEFKKCFKREGRDNILLYANVRNNFEEVNELYLQLWIKGHNHRFIFCQIDYEDDGGELPE